MHAQPRVRPLRTLADTLSIIVALLLLLGCGTTAPPLLLVDELETLDRERVSAAAGALRTRGAAVAVIAVARGDARAADFDQRLNAAGLLHDGLIAPDAIALYVSFAPRYSELRAGERWSRALPADTLRAIRLDLLNPALRDGQTTDGIAQTLAALDARIASAAARQRLTTAVSFGILAAVLVLLLTPLGGWLWDVTCRSPIGKLAQWLYDRTPFGRSWLQRATQQWRLIVKDSAALARSYCQLVSATNAEGHEVKARLTGLDEEHQRAEHSLRGRALFDALYRIGNAYKSLTNDAMRLVPPKPQRAKASSASFSSGFVATEPSPEPYNSSSTSSSSDWSSDRSSSDNSPSSDGGAW